jgi:cytochrome P450
MLPKGPSFKWLQTWLFLFRHRSYSAWLRRRYDDIVTLRLLLSSAPVVMVLTPEGARQVLTADADGYDAIFKEGFTALVGPGSIWVLEGLRHRRERQLLLPAFHARQIPSYRQAIKEVTLLHINEWRVGQDMRAYDAMLDISRDVILRMGFGVERGAIRHDVCRVLKTLLDSAHPLFVFFPIFRARWFSPWVRFQRAKDEFSKFVQRCKECRGLGSERQTLLELFISARFDDGTALSDDEIRDELVTVLLSGHETTAVALSWALYELGRHPAVLRRLREELDALGPNPDPDLIVQQQYLGAVCDETLRLHTILTEVGRVVRAPLQLLGYTVPAGMGVMVSISAIHQDPSLYAEPDQFRPERFMERTFSPFEFLPFGGGHRRCPGAALADYQMRIVLATIIRNWEFEISGKEQDIRHNIGTGPKYGVRMRLNRPRSIELPSLARLDQQKVATRADETTTGVALTSMQPRHTSQNRSRAH